MNPSVIVRPSMALPSEKRIAIYELSTQKEFIHPDRVWKMCIKRTPRSHVPSGKKGKSIDRAKEKRLILNPHRGKINIGKLSAHLGISWGVVYKYLNHMHAKGRDKHAEDNIDKPAFLKLSLSESLKLKKELWKRNTEEYKIKVAEELALDVLHNPSWHDTRKSPVGRCENCNIMIGNTRTGHKKICSRCSMKENNYEKKKKHSRIHGKVKA